MRPKYKAKYLRQRKINRNLAWGFIVALLITILVVSLTYEQDDLICPAVDCTTAVNTVDVPARVREYLPSENTIKIMNANTGITAKIHTYFGEDWLKYAELIARESSFDPSAINPTSGACGLSQSLPCSKMQCSLDYEGVECQLNWIDEYINARYGEIDKALYHHDLVGWY